MRLVLQRVTKACVTVNNEVVGCIDKGCLVLMGISKTDTRLIVEKAVEKIKKLRIFADDNGKTNLSSADISGAILVVSQFTLQAELTQNRPSFSSAAPAEFAKDLYDYFVDCCQGNFFKVQTGQFGAHMHVNVENDGPFTLVIEM